MRSTEIDLSCSGVEGRGRNGWLKVAKIHVVEYPSREEGDGPRVSVSISSAKPSRSCAPIVLEGPTEELLQLFETVVGFLKGVE